jgi:hypothetical protein
LVTDGYQTLGPGGRALWDAIAEEHQLDAGQKVQLLEACRAKDRLDRLDTVLRGDADVWMKLTHRLQTEDYELKIDAALQQANTTANLLKQLLAALRLPDATTGKQPQRRAARGAYKTGGIVSSIDRARAARGA